MQASCLFVPFISDPAAVKELVAAVSPKPVNLVIHEYDASIRDYAKLGVRRISLGGSLARRASASCGVICAMGMLPITG